MNLSDEVPSGSAYPAPGPGKGRSRGVDDKVNNRFFQVRVAALRDRIAAGLVGSGADGIPAIEVLRDVLKRSADFALRHENLVLDDLLPAAAERGFHFVHWLDITDEERAEVRAIYDRLLHPVLTPLAVDPAHPFPAISNLSLNIGVLISTGHSERFARIKVPDVLPRFVRLDCTGRYVLLEHVISANLNRLFGDAPITGKAMFRVTRNTDLAVDSDEADDLLETIEMELRRRRFGAAVRLELGVAADPRIVDLLMHELELTSADVITHRGPLGLASLHQVADFDVPKLKFPKRTPHVPDWISDLVEGSIFDAIDRGDRLVIAGGCSSRSHRARHLLPAARRAGHLGQHPRAINLGPLSGAFTGLSFRQR